MTNARHDADAAAEWDDPEAISLSDEANPHIAAVISRRALLGGFGAGALAAALPPARDAAAQGGSTLGFASLPMVLDERHRVAAGYRADIVIRWGEPVEKGAPPFDIANQRAAAQAKQFGYNNDFLAFFPLPRGSASSEHGLLWVNHEYTNAELMRPGLPQPPDSMAANAQTATKEWTEIEIAAHGGAIVEIRKDAGVWKTVADSAYGRRITADTPMRIAGPAAGHERLKTKADPTGRLVRGTLNNCAGGKTPWGTALTGEENVNAYFAGDIAKSGEQRNHRRFGVPGKDRALYAWHRFHERFDIDREPNEINRFGWVVEIDPHDPGAMPVKRTALGRMKHEGATCVIGRDGRIVVYTADDQAGEYVYKFVSRGRFEFANRAANRDLLDDGVLHAARFNDDGTLDWLPLVHGEGKLTAENGFAGQADVLIEARRAADLVGATRMDRPEDIEASPVTGKVYVVLTNHLTRGESVPVDRANPRAKNTHGHIIEIVPPGGGGGNADHAAAKARWDIFLLAGNPADTAHGARYHADQAASGIWLACPDNVAFDPKGRLYIATDQGSAQRRTKLPDGVFVTDAEGPGRGLTRLLYSAPIGAEVCGPEFTPDGKTLFVAIQHPGEGTLFENPSTRWPDFKPGMPPRPSVVAITKRRWRPDRRLISGDAARIRLDWGRDDRHAPRGASAAVRRHVPPVQRHGAVRAPARPGQTHQARRRAIGARTGSAAAVGPANRPVGDIRFHCRWPRLSALGRGFRACSPFRPGLAHPGPIPHRAAPAARLALRPHRAQPLSPVRPARGLPDADAGDRRPLPLTAGCPGASLASTRRMI